MRKRNAAITNGETYWLPSPHDHQVLLYFRKNQEQVVLVMLNVSNDSRLTIHIEHPWLPGNYRQLFSQLEYSFTEKASFELQAGEYLVYEKI